MINIRQTVSDDGGSLLEFKRRNPISQVVVYYVCRITKWSFSARWISLLCNCIQPQLFSKFFFFFAGPGLSWFLKF
jgi:hypothetical protein